MTTETFLFKISRVQPHKDKTSRNTMDENNYRLNELIKRIADGDAQAQVDFLHEYGKLIKCAAISASGKALSDEVLSLVFEKIVVNAKSFAKKEITTCWLYKLTVNVAKNVAKKEGFFYKVHQPLSDEAATYYCAIEEEKSLSRLDFERIMKILNDDEKKIITMKCVYELTFTQIADELKKPVSTISTQYYGALDKVKKHF